MVALSACHRATFHSRGTRNPPVSTLQGERESYASALTLLHRAFDERAGRRVFADDVDEFLQSHVEHVPCRDAIQDFFDASREVFFGGDVLAVPRSSR